MSRPAPSRSLLRPADVIDHVTHITPEFLADRGLHGLLLDLDNTLVPYGSYDPAGVAQTLAWVRDLKLAGVGLYLLSNATGQRAAFWLDKLDFQGVGLAGKPNPRAFRKALRALKLPPAQVGMVGDQLFTDVLGGNLSGMHTILVRPLVTNALPHTRVARRLERAVLKRYGHDWHH
ncbi:hydrolase [Deinococcus grandis]|uniref:Hydrolase n=1 Tax=Deinococcus grandis TaxID=57498 RepID=A0A100HLL6_9DEIO|nr:MULTISPECIES: YqeG family HAD IIIA-type phosphatase [Deinococcus]RIY04184.1 YqeG family HAD IIIA-type phosphatase [Deinococcus sp. RM]BBN93466.1 haloacid dehalogenase [Deinococcus grandis]GAQ23023.1 hydrolase [Deinococcus grandis]